MAVENGQDTVGLCVVLRDGAGKTVGVAHTLPFTIPDTAKVGAEIATPTKSTRTAKEAASVLKLANGTGMLVFTVDVTPGTEVAALAAAHATCVRFAGTVGSRRLADVTEWAETDGTKPPKAKRDLIDELAKAIP